jgi:methionine sulfoxide reductase catalytic subunit
MSSHTWHPLVPVSRRRFLALGLSGLAGSIVTACAPVSLKPLPATTGATAPPEAAAAGAATNPSPSAAQTLATVTPMGAAPPGTILGNENIPEFYVRYYRSFPAPDPATWQLTVEGLVEAPVTLTPGQIQRELAYREQNTRMKCVECWSSRATWGGFDYASLAALVKPKPEATHLRFDCADNYWEVLPISELQRAGALFVTHMNGNPVPAKYGSPLRMIIPWLYGYKGAKAVTKLTFQAEQEPGYWSTVGPYSVEGRIQAGQDHPLDLGGARPIQGGEITAY